MSMFAMRLLRQSALLAPVLLALVGPANASAGVLELHEQLVGGHAVGGMQRLGLDSGWRWDSRSAGFAQGGCATFSSGPGNFQQSTCLQAAYGKGKGKRDDPFAFRKVVGVGMSATTSQDG